MLMDAYDHAMSRLSACLTPRVLHGDRVILGDRHDLPSGELLLVFALRGGVPSKDCGNSLVGILKSESCILRMLLPLAII